MSRSHSNHPAIAPTIVFALSLTAHQPDANAGEPAGMDNPFEQDRNAILSMAGDFEVTFQFRETVAIAPDYQLRKPYLEHATETVKVVTDGGDRIVLQHLLLDTDSDRVIKHWKQEWVYEDRDLYGFKGDNTWVTHRLALEEITGTWSQRVSQVDDSPRYESYGTWRHVGGLSSWTSKPTRRPLPRREYTKRDDYKVMMAVNRHTLTPTGWVHEQDNFKQVDVGGEVLCREVGLNEYTRTTDIDFTLANDYWDQTHKYWKLVSSRWDDALDSGSRLALKKTADGKPLYKHLFGLAKKHAEGKLVDLAQTEAAVDSVLEKFIVPE